jgi:hypothetical protein
MSLLTTQVEELKQEQGIAMENILQVGSRNRALQLIISYRWASA